MKNRLLLTLIFAVGIAALYFGIARPEVTRIPSSLRDPLTDLKPPIPPLEPPALVIPELPPFTLPPMRPFQPVVRSDPVPARPEVPIQNQATIDFSTGAPVVRVHGKDQEALERALKEMAEVLENTKIEVKK